MIADRMQNEVNRYEYEKIIKLVLFFLFLTLNLTLITTEKCAQAETAGKSFVGIEITVGVQNGPAIGGPAESHARIWAKKTGGRVKVVKYPFGKLFEAYMEGLAGKEPKFDVVLYAPAWAGDFYTYLSPLPDKIRNDESFDDIHPIYRDRLMKWNEQWIAVTVDGDLFNGYYRKDLFEDEENSAEFKKRYGYSLDAPNSWQEYRDIAEFFTGRVGPNGEKLYGSAEAFARGGQQFWDLFSRAAAYTNAPDCPGAQFFNPDTMSPQINNPGWLRAVKNYKEILNFSPPEAKGFDIVRAREAFIKKKQAAMALDWGDTAQIAEDAETSGIAGKVGYFMLPGSRDVWSLCQNKWIKSFSIRKVPFLAFGGWVASVPRNSRNKDAAWDYIMCYSSPENSMKDVVTSGSGINPYRFTHFLNIDAWNQAFSRNAATEYLAMLQKSLNSPFAALDLRIPGFFKYTESLEIELVRILNNEVSIEDGMDRVAARWDVITDKYNRSKQLMIYRASMGLPQGFEKQDIITEISLLPEGKKKNKEKYRVGFSQATTTEPWRLLFNKELRNEAAKYPEIELFIADGNDDVKKQKADVENFIRQKVDAILISPKVAKGLTVVVNKAFDMGIPVFVLDRDLANDRYTQYIGGDNKEIGRAAGRYAVDYLGGARQAKGRIVEIWGGMASTPAHNRHRGFHEIIENEPGIILLSKPRDGDWKQDLGYEIMVDALEKFKKIDLVYAHNDPMAYGAYLAAKEIGREKEIAFLGIDGIPIEGVKWVHDGILKATFLYKTPGDEGIRQVFELFHKGKVKKRIKLPTQTIDKSNAEQILKDNELL